MREVHATAHHHPPASLEFWHHDNLLIHQAIPCGSASLKAEFVTQYPAQAKKFVAAYAKGIALVRSNPTEARQYLKGYTAIEGPLSSEVPLAAYTLYNEFTPKDIAHFQKFFDLFSDKGIFSSRLLVESMLYKG